MSDDTEPIDVNQFAGDDGTGDRAFAAFLAAIALLLLVLLLIVLIGSTNLPAGS